MTKISSHCYIFFTSPSVRAIHLYQNESWVPPGVCYYGCKEIALSYWAIPTPQGIFLSWKISGIPKQDRVSKRNSKSISCKINFSNFLIYVGKSLEIVYFLFSLKARTHIGLECAGSTDLNTWMAGSAEKLRQSGRHIGPVKKAVVTALLSMKILWNIQEDDPNNAFLRKKKNMWKRTDVKYWCS